MAKQFPGHQSSTCVFYSFPYEQYQCSLPSQDEASLEALKILERRAERSYHEGQPRYFSDHNRSVVKIVPWTTYMEFPVGDVQSMISRSHILITDVPTLPLAFDKTGLGSLRSLQARINVDGGLNSTQMNSFISLMSTDHSQNNLVDRRTSATLEHVYEASQKPEGAIVDATFPLPLSEVTRSPINSDVEAWFHTEGVFDERQYPRPKRWASCSTEGAFQGLRVHSDGLGSCMEVRCGVIWVFLFEISYDRGHTHFGSVKNHLVTLSDWHADDVNIDVDIHVEAVCLPVGTRL